MGCDVDVDRRTMRPPHAGRSVLRILAGFHRSRGFAHTERTLCQNCVGEQQGGLES